MSIVLKDVVFLSAPKTGTSWVEKRFREGKITKSYFVEIKKPSIYAATQTKHVPLYKYNDDIYPIERYKPFNNKKAFTFTRHPLTWYRSIFSFWVKKGEMREPRAILNRSKEYNFLNLNKFYFATFRECRLDFKTFIQKVLKYRSSTNTGYWSSVSRIFIYQCNRIGKFENLIDDLLKILNDLDVRYQPEDYLINKSNLTNVSNSYRQLYTRELAEEIMQMEYEYVHEFDYDYIDGDWIK